MIETVSVGERRSFHLVHLNDLGDWPSDLPLRDQTFVLWVGGDTRHISVEAITTFVETTLAQGLVHLCTWGPGCERLHDLFDEIIVVQGLTPRTVDVVVTTWHADDPLDDALWFFANTAWPAEDRASGTSDWIAVALGTEEDCREVAGWLKSATLK